MHTLFIITLFTTLLPNTLYTTTIKEYMDKATQCHKTKRPHEAKENYLKALDIDPDNKKVLEELAFIHFYLSEFEEAHACLKKALKDQSIVPPNTLYLKGHLLKHLSDYDQSIKVLEELHDVVPSASNVLFDLQRLYMAIGDFTTIQSRWPFKDSPWNDLSNVKNKHILLRLNFSAGFRFGDIFMHIRHAKKLKDAGAYVTVEVNEPLIPVLSELPYIDNFITTNSPIPDGAQEYQIDQKAHCVFATRALKKPDVTPYLYAQPDLIEKWQERLAPITGLKIGINWHCSIIQDVYDNKITCGRTMPLKLFKPLAEIPHVSLISLQKEYGVTELDDIDFSIHHFGSNVDTDNGRFVDTAAIIKNLDLVITTDTAIAHLAAGLGVPTWVMLPKNSEWRWFTDRTDSPWYPTMKLFRQTERGNWKPVLKRITQELTELFNA